MNKSIHFFDLDDTLINTHAKLVVISKEEPQTVIYRINNDEINFLKSNYKKYDLEVNYNGNTWYLNPKIWDDIKRIKKDIHLSDLGISFREFDDKEYFKKQLETTTYMFSNLEHLKSFKCDIGIITAKQNKEAFKENLEVIKNKIKLLIDKDIQKIYFINDIDDNNNSDITAYRKAIILLEHLIGFKIKLGSFNELKQTPYESVFLYDDNKNNISMVDNIQNIFEEVLSNTNIDIKQEIVERGNNNKLYYTSCFITENRLNPFILKKAELLLPNKVKRFDNF